MKELLSFIQEAWYFCSPEQKRAIGRAVLKLVPVFKKHLVEHGVYTQEEMTELDAYLEQDPRNIHG